MQYSPNLVCLISERRANVYEKWESKVYKRRQKAWRNGITVSLIQTNSDKKSIYLYLKVKSEDKKLNNGMSFVWAKINIKGFGNIDGVAGDINAVSYTHTYRGKVLY